MIFKSKRKWIKIQRKSNKWVQDLVNLQSPYSCFFLSPLTLLEKAASSWCSASSKEKGKEEIKEMDWRLHVNLETNSHLSCDAANQPWHVTTANSCNVFHLYDSYELPYLQLTSTLEMCFFSIYFSKKHYRYSSLLFLFLYKTSHSLAEQLLSFSPWSMKQKEPIP